MTRNFTDVCVLEAEHKLALSRLRRITFSLGNVTATEIKIKLMLLLDICQRYEKGIFFLYCCDVSEMIVCTKKKIIK